MTNNTELEQEAELIARINELENKDLKEDQQRRMAWVAMLSMLFLTAFLFSPMVVEARIDALVELIGTFYMAMATVVAAFFGASAYTQANSGPRRVISRKKPTYREDLEDGES